MAISCPNCKRQYDVTLFQFGRTIDCTCGERVGFETRISLPPNIEIKFFADVMVGRLTRWLRALGIDTTWEDAIPDGELVRRAIEEKRYILTLDRRLPEEWRVENVLLLKSQNTFEQFRETVTHFNLPRPRTYFTRCLVCNNLLRQASAEEIIEAEVSLKVLENQPAFQYCSNCGKVYWQGSHTTRMRSVIEDVFDRRYE